MCPSCGASESCSPNECMKNCEDPIEDIWYWFWVWIGADGREWISDEDEGLPIVLSTTTKFGLKNEMGRPSGDGFWEQRKMQWRFIKRECASCIKLKKECNTLACNPQIAELCVDECGCDVFGDCEDDRSCELCSLLAPSDGLSCGTCDEICKTTTCELKVSGTPAMLNSECLCDATQSQTTSADCCSGCCKNPFCKEKHVCNSNKVRECLFECPSGPDGTNPLISTPRCEDCGTVSVECSKPCVGEVARWCADNCNLKDLSDDKTCWNQCGPYYHCITGGRAPCFEKNKVRCELGLCEEEDKCNCDDYVHCPANICAEEEEAIKCQEECLCGPWGPAYLNPPDYKIRKEEQPSDINMMEVMNDINMPITIMEPKLYHGRNAFCIGKKCNECDKLRNCMKRMYFLSHSPSY